MEQILRLFPPHVRKHIAFTVEEKWDKLEEIRCRLFYPIELIYEDNVEWISQVVPDLEVGTFLINQLSEYSLYRMENELREGYITIEGGHRVGIAGKVNTVNGTVKMIQNISFFNIRIAKQKIGVAEQFIPSILEKEYKSTLIIGPPQSGKTTLIRDIVRIISTGWKETPGKKVAVIDERSEIGASIQGIPQYDLGIRTDVMDACPKAEGMMMMIRSMSPDVLVVDEIGGKKDVDALLEAIHAGVTIICTIHGRSFDDLRNRPLLKKVFELEIFERFIVLGRRIGSHQPYQVIDERQRTIQTARD